MRNSFFLDFCYYKVSSCLLLIRIENSIMVIVEIRTFEVLLRTYEVGEGKMDCSQGSEGGPLGAQVKKAMRERALYIPQQS